MPPAAWLLSLLHSNAGARRRDHGLGCRLLSSRALSRGAAQARAGSERAPGFRRSAARARARWCGRAAMKSATSCATSTRWPSGCQLLVSSQKQLLSDISHELRSPLARLQVAVELARRKAGPDAEKHLNRIEAEGTRMNEMIGQILTLARADSDRPAVSEQVDLARDCARRRRGHGLRSAPDGPRQFVCRRADEADRPGRRGIADERRRKCRP